MFNRYGKFFLLAVASLLLASCATTYKVSYNYNNVSYATAEEGLAAQKAGADALLSKVTTTEHPVGGSAVVIVPSFVTVRRDYVAWSGPEPTPEVKDKAMNYSARLYLNDWRSRGELLEKRRVFDRVAIREEDDPDHAEFTEDFAVISSKKDAKGRWFLRKKGADPASAVPIEEASAALPPAQRNMIWMDNIAKTVSDMKK